MQKSLAELTDKDFEDIKNMAELFFTPREIALMMEVSCEIFIDECANPDTKLFNAFQSGRLQSELDLRKSIIKLAKSGSSPAQTMAMDLLNKSTLKMLNR